MEYGKTFEKKIAGDYFENYLNQIGRSYDIDEKDYQTDLVKFL